MNKRSAVSKVAMKRLRVLLDLDQVLADFEGYFLEKYREKYPDDPYVPLDKRKGFHLTDQYKHFQPGVLEKTREIYHAEGFFLNLPEIPRACDAARELAEMDEVDVFICTSPVITNTYCYWEKFQWVKEHLGQDWLQRTIITKDKTVVNGHILIDDNPKIIGTCDPPMWQHILFRATHNRTVKFDSRHVLENWTDGSWRDLIKDFLKKI